MKTIDPAEVDEKLERFKESFWAQYTKKALTPDKAAKKYLKGIKKRQLYIFDSRIMRVAMFIKAVAQWLYRRVLRGQGKQHEEMVKIALKEVHTFLRYELLFFQ